MNYKNNALCVIYDDSDRFLMQLRSKDAPVLPGYLGFFGGNIEENEKPDEAIRREIFEEIKYTSCFEFYRLRYALVINFVEKAYIYINKFEGNPEQVIAYEGDEAVWIDKNVIKYDIMRHDIQLLEELFEFNQNRRLYEQATNI